METGAGSGFDDGGRGGGAHLKLRSLNGMLLRLRFAKLRTAKI
jgi:hypothetical protein